MRNVTDIASQLTLDEDKRKFPYLDTKGKTTIGIGRNLTDDGLADDEISYLLKNDLSRVQNSLGMNIPWFSTLDPPRQGVLVNMAFNMGVHGLLGFHDTLSAMAKQDWEAAAVDMENSLWAKEVGDRATRLAQQLRTGIWQ